MAKTKKPKTDTMSKADMEAKLDVLNCKIAELESERSKLRIELYEYDIKRTTGKLIGSWVKIPGYRKGDEEFYTAYTDNGYRICHIDKLVSFVDSRTAFFKVSNLVSFHKNKLDNEINVTFGEYGTDSYSIVIDELKVLSTKQLLKEVDKLQKFARKRLDDLVNKAGK